MSGILAVLSPDPEATSTAAVRPTVQALHARGADHEDLWSTDGATLGVLRHGWETGDGFAGPAVVVRDGDLAVVTDASLYYRDDLLRALDAASVRPRGTTPGHLILAAYRAWGAECAARLEGDFAFLLWDGAQRRLLGCRDFGGKRPLFHAEVGGTLLVASTIGALLAHPRCPADLDLAAVAADAAGLFAAPRDTPYRAIRRLPAGWSLLHTDGDGVRTSAHWAPPQVRPDPSVSFEDAAVQLREILTQAVAERRDPNDPTSIWLSGGWDSTAVFAAGERWLRKRGAGGHLRAVSISFPRGDPGREDHLIGAVADHWGAPVRWLDITRIPLLEHARERAVRRDEPFAHAFEGGNRALAGGSRAAGTRVALDGVGGDQLFQVSAVYLADLLARGRWRSLARELRSTGIGRGGPRNLFRWMVQPLLPDPALALAARLRGGRPLRGNLERPVPAWLRADFVRRHRILERDRAHLPPRAGDRDRAAYETHWYLAHPYFPRVFACVSSLALEAGVEVRSPLYDRRVVEYALTRPREERASGRETKRLLRQAMRGLLPDRVLTPRRYRTGVTGGYLSRSLRRLHAPLLDRTFAAPMRLVDLGIVDPAPLRSAWSDYLRTGDGNLGVNLLLTFQTELWLRGRTG